jgi:hypothetical protein
MRFKEIGIKESNELRREEQKKDGGRRGRKRKGARRGKGL